MSDSALHAQTAAAQAYEELFVPALFSQWTGRVAGIARITTGEHVLDVAGARGCVARTPAWGVGPSGSVAGVDANAGMLAVAAALAPGIAWRQCGAEALPYPDGSFDAVVSQFGLMFFHDRRKALHEVQRVLKSGGRLAVAVWGPLESAPAYADEVKLVERLAGKAAADALRAPFALGDSRELAQLVSDASGMTATITTERGTARFPSIRAMVEAELRGWLPLMDIVLPEDLIERILAEAERALRSYVTGAGTVAFPVSAHIASGSKSTAV